jgi:hypothetical protein
MKTLAAAAFLATLAGTSAAFALDPIPGSLTYNGARPQLQQAPAGSTVFHNFNFKGDKIREVYRVNADRTVTLVQRGIINE